jgi:hypothetical protein
MGSLQRSSAHRSEQAKFPIQEVYKELWSAVSSTLGKEHYLPLAHLVSAKISIVLCLLALSNQ